jgi:hypothetical protein
MHCLTKTRRMQLVSRVQHASYIHSQHRPTLSILMLSSTKNNCACKGERQVNNLQAPSCATSPACWAPPAGAALPRAVLLQCTHPPARWSLGRPSPPLSCHRRRAAHRSGGSATLHQHTALVPARLSAAAAAALQPRASLQTLLWSQSADVLLKRAGTVMVSTQNTKCKQEIHVHHLYTLCMHCMRLSIAALDISAGKRVPRRANEAARNAGAGNCGRTDALRPSGPTLE